MDSTSSTKHTSYLCNPPSNTSYVHYQSSFPKKRSFSKPNSIIKKHLQHPFKPPSISSPPQSSNQPTHSSHSLIQPQHASPLTSVTLAYLNDMTQRYEGSKAKSVQAAVSLQTEIASAKSHIDSTVAEYENRIKALQHQHACELTTVRSRCVSHYNREITRKDEELKLLLVKNTQLTKCNEDLLNKLTRYLETINNTQIGFNGCVAHLEGENASLRNEVSAVKASYERKMELLRQNFEEEKNGLIYHYESALKELQEGHEQSTESYHRIMRYKDCDVEDLVQTLKNENEKLKWGCKENKDQISKLMEDNLKLRNDNKKAKHDIECVKEELERVKKENMCYFKKRNEIEEDLARLSKEHNAIKKREKQLNRLTYGKLKKK